MDLFGKEHLFILLLLLLLLLLVVVVVVVVVVVLSSVSPLCRVSTLIFPRKNMSLRNTVLQLLRCYYSWCVYR